MTLLQQRVLPLPPLPTAGDALKLLGTWFNYLIDTHGWIDRSPAWLQGSREVGGDKWERRHAVKSGCRACMEQRCWKQNRAGEADMTLNPSTVFLDKEEVSRWSASMVSLRA